MLAFVNTLTNVGLPATLFRIYHGKESETDKSQVVGSTLILLVVIAFIPAAGFSLFSNSLSYQLFQTTRYASTIILVACILVVETLMDFGGILLRHAATTIGF